MKYLLYGVLLPIKDEEESIFRQTDLPSLQKYCYENNDNIISSQEYHIAHFGQSIELADVEEFLKKIGDLVLEQGRKCKE